MIRDIKILFAAVVIFAAFSSCDDDDALLSGTGIESCSWTVENVVDIKGDLLIYEFTAAGAWTATSTDSWCQVLTGQGPAGLSTLRISVDPNGSTEERSAVVTVRVKGFESQAQFTVKQPFGIIEQGSGKYRNVNKWIAEYMSTHYLWNDPVKKLMLDYSIDYQSFLTSILDGVAAQDDANHDDGHWNGEKRENYYSFIQSDAPLARSTGTQYTDAGFMLLQPTILGYSDDAPVGVSVKAVTPGTPADKAGLKRGDFISTVNGVSVTESNYQTLTQQIYAGNVSIGVNDVAWSNSVPTVTFRENVYLGAATYIDPAIYKHDIIELRNGKKAGYLLYNGFDTSADEELIRIFKEFRDNSVTDLILDFRYNPGGELLSSVVVNTLVAGSGYRGKVSTQVKYNASRTEAGESGLYRIGEAVNVEYPDGYRAIEDALGASVELKRVYMIVTSTTASASEAVINGLRGLGIEVLLIGQTTNGKNVGMEGIRGSFNGYSFMFYPVTFYCENAGGFSDYSSGFDPDLAADDSGVYPGDFGTQYDYYTSIAMEWIASGSKPDLAQGRSGYGNEVRVLEDPAYFSRLNRRTGGTIMLRELR